MKKSKKIILSITSIALVLGLSASAYMILSPKEEIKVSQNKVEVKHEPEVIEQVEEIIEQTVSHSETVQPAPIEIIEEPVDKPLTLHEYATSVLDLSTPELISCFNSIVAEFPNRFEGEQSHANVRALRAYASVCSSGINNSINGNIYLWDKASGVKGSFFDSELAKSNH